MATIFCASGGSNTSPYDTWAKAATSLQTAITQAANGDTVVLQYNAVPAADAELGADTTYTFDADCLLLSASNDGGSAFTPTVMGTGNWIGNSTTNRFVRFAGNDLQNRIWGLTIRTAGATADIIGLAYSEGSQHVYDNCYFWASGSMTGNVIEFCSTNNASCTLLHCTIRFGATGQSIIPRFNVEIIGGSISSAGSAPTTLFSFSGATPAVIRATGWDLSHVTGTILGNGGFGEIHLERCKLGSGATMLGSQTSNPNQASGHVFVYDCHSGDTHGIFGYHNALGSLTSDTGIYFTAGAAAQSWKIVTTANATFYAPFVSPWIDLYNTGTSAITPYLEILRDGSATAYQDDEVWGEFSYKGTSGFVDATTVDDRKSIAGTAADQAAGAGTGSWTGEGGTAWSGKVQSASITPAENGYLRARVHVGEPSITVYVDPFIRT